MYIFPYTVTDKIKCSTMLFPPVFGRFIVVKCKQYLQTFHSQWSQGVNSVPEVHLQKQSAGRAVWR